MYNLAFGMQEWLTNRIGSVEREKSIARRADISTIMMRSLRVARIRASPTLIDSPRISPILRLAGTGSVAKAPRPSIVLSRTSTANF